nr:hypothetical protein [Tanacetum cinerariifolium]
MANQEQNLPQQEQPFVAAKQVRFNLEDIILNTNNEVALLCPKHTNKENFKCVSDFISKCCLRKPFTKSPNMYQEYRAEFWYSAKALENSKVSFSIPTGEVSTKRTLRKSLLPSRWMLLMAQIIECLMGKTGGFDQITNKDDIMLYSIANGIHIDYANIFWEDIILKLKKKQREKVVPYTRFLSLLIMHKMKEDYSTDELQKPLQEMTVFPKAQKLGAKTRHKKPTTSSKQPSVSSKEATKGRSSKAPTGSKISHSKGRKESSSAMDSNPNRPSVSTPVDIKMHKEDQQATGGPTSLGVTRIDEGTKYMSYDHISAGTDPHVLTDQTKYVSEGLETVLTQPTIEKEASSTAIHDDKKEASSKIKLEDLTKLVSQIQPSFKDLDSPKDDHVIIVDESDEDEPNAQTEDTSSQKHKLEHGKNKAKAEAALLKTRPSFPNVEQLNELLFNELTEEIKGLKTQVHELEIELPKEIKEIPTKLPPRSSSQPKGEHIKKDKGKKVMSSEEVEKESTESDSYEEAYVTSSMVKSSKEKKLKKFNFVTEDERHIYLSEEQINNQKKLDEEAKAKIAKQEREVKKAELVDLLGREVGFLPNLLNKRAHDIIVYHGFVNQNEVYQEYNDLLEKIITTMRQMYGEKIRVQFEGVIEEFVNVSLDSSLDSDDMKDEFNEEVHRVLTAIPGDTPTHSF